MADFHFTVDTDPMAREISTVSKHVDGVSSAVVTMQTAVILAEQKAADHVCENVNHGFYTLMRSQLSQKIAQLTSTVESKLIEMGQQAAALQSIRKRMERDYNMISGRYGKLFGSLNASLQSQVYQLDKPVVNLVNRDVQLSENRIKGALASTSTHQTESIKLSQQIVVSKTKGDSEQAIETIHRYVEGVTTQNRMAEDVMRSRRIEQTEDIFLPVIIAASASELNPAVVSSYAPKSGDERIDTSITQAIREDAHEAVRSLDWEAIAPQRRQELEAEYTTLLTGWNTSERVKKLAMELFKASALQQFKKERV